MPSDGFYGGLYRVPEEEGIYHISIATSSIDSGYYNIARNLTRFTTAGPITVDTYSIMHPDDNDSLIVIKDLTLINMGSDLELSLVMADLKIIDSCVTKILNKKIAFGKISPGESKKTPFGFGFLTENCSDEIRLLLEISSNNYVYWYDTLIIDLGVVVVEEEMSLPSEYALFQNHPNPFNPSTTIKYSIPRDVKRKTKDVKLLIYDILGREVVTLVNEKQKPGNYEITWNAVGQPSGVYFYQIQAGKYIETKKMILLR